MADGRWKISRGILAVVSAFAVFMVVSLLAFLAARYLLDGILLPTVIAIFCGFAAATVLNATDVLARRTGRQQAGGRDRADRDNQCEDGSAP